jgi:hypothetical protein
MRLAAPLLAVLIVSCGDEGGQAPAGEAVECAIGGGGFARNCTMERRETAEGLTLTIRNPSGGFRRILLPKDGSGAVAADGAERARVAVLGDGRAEVAIAGDRYRLPVEIPPGAGGR